MPPAGRVQDGAGRNAERADIVAWLGQRRDNAALMAARFPHDEPLAADRRRQLEVLIDEIGAGMHLGHVAGEGE